MASVANNKLLILAARCETDHMFFRVKIDEKRCDFTPYLAKHHGRLVDPNLHVILLREEKNRAGCAV